MGYHPPPLPRRNPAIAWRSGHTYDTTGGIWDPWSVSAGDLLAGYDPFGWKSGSLFSLGEAWRRPQQTRPAGIFVPPVVISETPQTKLPKTGGTSHPIGTSGPLQIPKGWETTVIGGVERVVVPKVYTGGTPPVLEPFDPNVVIGEVHGKDTAAQNDSEEETGMDWGALASGVIDIIQGQQPGGTLPPVYQTPGFAGPVRPGPGGGGGGGGFTTGGTMAAGDCEPCGPRYLTYDCKTGKFSARRRRRRRRLVTPTDLADLASVVAITGKGAGMNQAVAAAIRR